LQNRGTVPGFGGSKELEPNQELGCAIRQSLKRLAAALPRKREIEGVADFLEHSLLRECSKFQDSLTKAMAWRRGTKSAQRSTKYLKNQR
jgi:hypothetical protein